MSTPLLNTKLYIPPLRPNLVPRPRLIQRLDEGLRLGRWLTLVSAPAGFGKTTLIAEWIGSSTREVAWISLGEEDNDPSRFLCYLIAALQQIDGRIGQTVQPILQSPQLPPVQGLVTPLINDIAAEATPLTLVLDDYHLITFPVHQIIQFLLEHQPPSMHVVISTREDPPLSLPRLRARGQVTEIRERDLRFTAQEAAAFLNQTMGLRLSAEAVAALEARTEGWVTGLQLAAIALQARLLQSPLALQADRADANAFIAAFTGDDRFVMDYLIEEVLQQQPETVRQFLQQTAILDRLTAPLCNAVTGRKDSQAILEGLEGANLFLIPLDHRREWYRYHRLFAEFLRTALDQEAQKVLHQRAMHWHEAHGFMSQAIGHALAYASASEEWSDAERLIRLAAEETILGGGMLTLRGWLDSLPDERVRANGELATYKGWMLALTGELDLAKQYADAAETHLCQTINRGKLLVLHSFIAVFGPQDYEASIELATRALQVLKKDQAHWRIIALWAMAESQERTRNITEAIATFREAQHIGRVYNNQIFSATVEQSLATDLNLHGQRRKAVAVCQEAIERHTDATGRTSLETSMIYSRLGVLYYESNQLELARKHLDRGLALSEQLAMKDAIIFSLGFSVPILHAQGETGAALEALQRAHQLATQTSLVDADWCLTLEAEIRLRQGDLPSVLRWAEAAGLSPDETPHYLRVERYLVYTRLLLALGRLSDARRLLARMERFTQRQGLYRWLITIHILQALTASRSGDRAVARDHLSQALQLAAPEDYFRAFLDKDDQIFALLPEVRHVAPSFVDQLLEYARGSEPGPPVVAQPLIEPLSERELEVLGLIVAGLSNREIAQELVIAIGTVKRHINNIYGKLGVHSRTQAIAKTRTLQLL